MAHRTVYYNSGTSFEKYIAELYAKRGKKNVTHDVLYQILLPKKTIEVQIDIVYDSLFSRRFVECKFHRENTPVGLEEIAKFYSQLELLGVSPKRGEVVTNTRYTYRALLYAESKGIKCYDKSDLQRWEQRISRIF